MSSDKHTRVKDRSGLVRSQNSGAIVSTDSDSLSRHKRKIKRKQEQEKEILKLKKDFDDINTRMESLESMLQQVLDKLD